MELIEKAALVAEIEKRLEVIANASSKNNREFLSSKNNRELTVIQGAQQYELINLIQFINTLEVKEVDVSSISENLAEAHSYLDYTHTSNLAHNKPMIAARLRKAIKELHSVGLFQLTHDEKYRMESLGLKSKGE